MWQMKATKQELEIAKQIRGLIESKVEGLETNIYKNNWQYAKSDIQNQLTETKQLLTEEQESELQISQIRTEGYISALEWVLFTFDSYED